MSSKSENNKQKFIDEVKNFCKQLPYFTVYEIENGITIRTNRYTGLSINFIVNNKSNKPEFYFSLRTTSWDYEGERTDLHDIISVCFAAFLRLYRLDISCALFDVPNPIIDNEGEIYARYIVPKQINADLYHDYFFARSIVKIKELLLNISIFEYFFWMAVGYPCGSCRKKLPRFDYKCDLPKVLKAKIIAALGESEIFSQSSRKLPNWYYYKDFTHLISVVNSEPLAKFMLQLIANNGGAFQFIQGINGDIAITTDIKNFIPNSKIEYAKKVFNILEGTRVKPPRLIPIENLLVAVGRRNILFFECLCGIEEYKKERERIRIRHSRECELLFSPEKFKWNERIDPEDFENLIKDLLVRERGVSWVRKTGRTTEADQGRDIILEWNLPPLKKTDVPLVENINPYKSKRIVVQCKAYKFSVNKSDVTDIRDTIENFNCHGFLLAVSGYLTSPLVNHLDKMRREGKYWIDWWSRDEIEERLKKHDDLIKKYRKIVIPIDNDLYQNLVKSKKLKVSSCI